MSPLALIAHAAGYEVSGSDMQESAYTENLRSHGITDIIIGQSYESLAELHEKSPIDWLVHTSAVRENSPGFSELQFAKDNAITTSKRDDFINKILQDTGQKMIAIAGTHGKTTTTAMVIWLFRQLDIPLSYSLGGKLSFGGIGEFNKLAEYFVYEADEYDRNFLSFHPVLSAITGIAYDHPDIYPTQENYNDAFHDFIGQSERTVIWSKDAEAIALESRDDITELDSSHDLNDITLAGEVNRQNAHLAISSLVQLELCTYERGVEIINQFPGVSRRFEKIAENIYTDYAHTPEKIAGALQLCREIAGDDVIVVYEGLHNTRQHFIREQLKELFTGVKKLIVVPSYRAREDESLEDLTPEKLVDLIEKPSDREPAELNDELKQLITKLSKDNLVICLSAGGGGSLDEWLRVNFSHIDNRGS